jgi:heme-degrading monooxygenase HmoA
MFARILRMKPKPDAGKGFAQAANDEIVPIMKKFAGFAGQITMLSSDGKEAVGISLWDCKENAETYNQERSDAVLKALEKHTEGKPELRTYEVMNTTFETLSGRKAA